MESNGSTEMFATLTMHRARYLRDYADIHVLGICDGDDDIRVGREAYMQRSTVSELERHDDERRRVSERNSGEMGLAKIDAGPVSVSEQTLINRLLRDSGTRVRVVGDGGTGKTEFCRNLAYRLAGAMTADDETGTPTFGLGCRVPVYVALRDLGQVGVDLRAHIGNLYGTGLPARVYEALARTGQIVYLLDGVDELTCDAAMFDELLA